MTPTKQNYDFQDCNVFVSKVGSQGLILDFKITPKNQMLKKLI